MPNQGVSHIRRGKDNDDKVNFLINWDAAVYSQTIFCLKAEVYLISL